MLLSFPYIQVPKCKVSKYPRYSYLSLFYGRQNMMVYSIRRYPIPITYIHGKLYNYNFTSLFYAKQDIIYYHYKADKFNKHDSEFSLLALYNYREESYNIINNNSWLSYPYSIGHLKMSQIIKTPNGILYALYVGKSGDSQADSLLVIINLSKNEELYYGSTSHKVGYSIGSYTLPVANSFVIVTSVFEDKIFVKTIDLINEKIYQLEYHIKDYVNSIIQKYMPDVQERQVTLNEYKINVTNHLQKGKDNLIFSERCVFDFQEIKLWPYCVIKEPFSLIVNYRGNELAVSLETNEAILTCSDGRQIKFEDKLVLMNKKYKIKNPYDISDSHLYSILHSCEDYTFIEGEIVKQPNIAVYYKNEQLDYIPSSKFEVYNVDGIILIMANDRIYASITREVLSKKYSIRKYFMIDNNGVILIINVLKIYQLLLIQSLISGKDKLLINIEAKEVIKNVNPIDIVHKMTKKLFRIFNDSSPVFSHFKYYLDNEKGYIYLLDWVHKYVYENNEGHYYCEYALLRYDVDKLFNNQNPLSVIWYFINKSKEIKESHRLLYSIKKGNIFYYLVNRSKQLEDNNNIDNIINPGEDLEDNIKIRWDLRYNRKSIPFRFRLEPILCILNLTKFITPL